MISLFHSWLLARWLLAWSQARSSWNVLTFLVWLTWYFGKLSQCNDMPNQSGQHYIISSNCTWTHKELVWATRNYNGSLAGRAQGAISYTFSCHYAGYHESIKVMSFILLFKVFATLIQLTSMFCQVNTTSMLCHCLSLVINCQDTEPILNYY
jgi:hypothetical protein